MYGRPNPGRTDQEAFTQYTRIPGEQSVCARAFWTSRLPHNPRGGPGVPWGTSIPVRRNSTAWNKTVTGGVSRKTNSGCCLRQPQTLHPPVQLKLVPGKKLKKKQNLSRGLQDPSPQIQVSHLQLCTICPSIPG